MKGDDIMFKRRSKNTDSIARVKAIIQRDRAAVRLQEKLDIRKKEDEENQPWDYSLFRRIVGNTKKQLHNWFWEKW